MWIIRRRNGELTTTELSLPMLLPCLFLSLLLSLFLLAGQGRDECRAQEKSDVGGERVCPRKKRCVVY
jgi:hypothetical protein